VEGDVACLSTICSPV